MSAALRRVGLLVPTADGVSEPDYQRFLPEGVVFHTGRLEQPKSLERDFSELQVMADQTPAVAELLALAEPEIIVFSCTSASFFRGRGFDRGIIDSIERAAGIPAVTTSTAAVAALEAVGARRIFMAMPYPEDIMATGIAYMEEAGFEVVGHVRFDCPKSNDLPNVGPDAVADGILESREMMKDADAAFISGTGFRGMEAVERLEAELGIPVVTANSATMWYALRHIGIDGSGIRAGRLFQLLAPAVKARVA